MKKCNGCEHEYDGVCMITEMECDEMDVCTMETNKAKEHNAGTAKRTETNKHDNVNHPKHYDGNCSIECIDNMRLIFGNQRVTDFCIVNAYKYLSRYKYKNGNEDLKKAKWYLDEAEVLKLTMETDFDYGTFDKLVDLCNRYMEEYTHGKGNE